MPLSGSTACSGGDKDHEASDFSRADNGHRRRGGLIRGEAQKRLTGYVTAVLDGCLARQRPDGLFHNVVDDPSSFVETNLAQMLATTIYSGVRDGWLEESRLAPARRLRVAARRKVDERGLVQGVCGSPNFDSPGTATEGQGFFLLMEAAARKLEKPA